MMKRRTMKILLILSDLTYMELKQSCFHYKLPLCVSLSDLTYMELKPLEIIFMLLSTSLSDLTYMELKLEMELMRRLGPN